MAILDQPIVVDSTTRLRPVRVDDASAIFSLVNANRPMLRQWLPWLDHNKSPEDTCAFLRSVIDQYDAGQAAVLLIESCGHPCGVVGFNWIAADNRSCGLGYWLDASHQGVELWAQACDG